MCGPLLSRTAGIVARVVKLVCQRCAALILVGAADYVQQCRT